MKLGLLHQVDTTKIHLEGTTLSFVSFEHKSLQELAAAVYICRVLQNGDDIQVNVHDIDTPYYSEGECSAQRKKAVAI